MLSLCLQLILPHAKLVSLPWILGRRSFGFDTCPHRLLVYEMPPQPAPHSRTVSNLGSSKCSPIVRACPPERAVHPFNNSRGLFAPGQSPFPMLTGRRTLSCFLDALLLLDSSLRGCCLISTLKEVFKAHVFLQIPTPTSEHARQRGGFCWRVQGPPTGDRRYQTHAQYYEFPEFG